MYPWSVLETRNGCDSLPFKVSEELQHVRPATPLKGNNLVHLYIKLRHRNVLRTSKRQSFEEPLSSLISADFTQARLTPDIDAQDTN